MRSQSMANELAYWLEEHGLAQHGDMFADNGVGLTLTHLSEDGCKKLGLNLVGRMRMQEALETFTLPKPLA